MAPSYTNDTTVEPVPTEREWLPSGEVARILGAANQTLRNLIEAGRLSYTSLVRHYCRAQCMLET